MVYIREAHALDGASPMAPVGDHPAVEEPLTAPERRAVAERCDQGLDLSPFTVLIDDMQNTASKRYASWPDRLYLVDLEGRLAYVGGPGPRGFSPYELEDAMREELGLPPIEREQKETPPRRDR